MEFLFVFIPISFISLCHSSASWMSTCLCPSYLNGQFGQGDMVQHWSEKYNEVSNAMDMVGFEEQVKFTPGAHNKLSLFYLASRCLHMLSHVTSRKRWTWWPSWPGFCLWEISRLSRLRTKRWKWARPQRAGSKPRRWVYSFASGTKGFNKQRLKPSHALLQGNSIRCGGVIPLWCHHFAIDFYLLRSAHSEVFSSNIQQHIS